MAQIVAWHGATANTHQLNLNTYQQQGYRTLSLSVYNTQQDPWYACVMILRAEDNGEQQTPLLNLATYEAMLGTMAKKGMVPQIVSATGAVGASVIAASFVPGTFPVTTQHDMTPAQFTALNNQLATPNAELQSQKLVWFDSYGTPEDPRFIAIWWPNTDLLAWNCDGVNEGAATAQQRFDGMAATWARLAQCVPALNGDTTSFYTDDVVGGWVANFGLSASEYQTFFDTQTAAAPGPALLPLRVCATGVGDAARFGVVFGQAEPTAPRTFVHLGPTTDPVVDSAVQGWMQAYGIRNTALAVLNGPRLVYVQGYTLAEPTYPAVQETTLFRLGSCSKLLAAYALYALLQNKLKATPSLAPSITALMKSTTLQSVLHLTQPNGHPPADTRFADITLFHLITSDSGIDQSLVQQITEAASASGLPLPLNTTQLARFVTTKPLTSYPGDPKNVVYGNTDYFLLGECIRAMSGAPSFAAAVESLVCQPLQMTHTRAARSLIGDQLPGEALYHLTQPRPANIGAGELTATPSVRSAQQPLVPTQYGGNPWDLDISGAAGGMSASVFDMAILAASLSEGADNPVLEAATITEWLTNAAVATETLTGPSAHGYHGFDWMDAIAGGFHGDKGGSLPGTGVDMNITTGGYTFIGMSGGQGRPGVTYTGFEPMLQQISLTPPPEWATINLFAKFHPRPRARPDRVIKSVRVLGDLG
jgi:Beta-lactamase/Bacterial tandem repeat domain 1